MKNVNHADYLSEERRLYNKGLTDKNVISALIEFRRANPELSRKKLPAEMYDKVNLMCRSYMDRLARFELDYDFIIDVQKFKNTAVCCLETVLCLRSQVINHPISPYWRVSDYCLDEFLTIKETDDIEKTRAEFFKRGIPLKSNIQMNIGLFFFKGKTYICFLWNHMCMDGGGFKMFWHDFCRNYSDYVNNGIAPLGFSFGSRKYTDVYKDLDLEKMKLAKRQFANVSPRLGQRLPYENDNREENVIIVSRRIEAEHFERAIKSAKLSGGTVTDLLLASYIDSFAKLTKLRDDERISVACATDLRRHIRDLSSIGYTNHVSFVHCDIDGKGKNFTQTLEKVSKKMKEHKQDEFMGLHGLPLLNIAYKTMIYFQAENVVRLFYNNPVLSVSNVGEIKPEDFVLDTDGPFDAFVAGAAKNKPCTVMTALSINGCLNASVCLRGNDKDREVLEQFFDEFEKNIKSL